MALSRMMLQHHLATRFLGLTSIGWGMTGWLEQIPIDFTHSLHA
jgi:hypothetical protein